MHAHRGCSNSTISVCVCVCVWVCVCAQALQQFHDISALDTRINDVFDFLDCDQSGTLSQEELNEGLKRLRSHTHTHKHTHKHTHTYIYVMPTSSPTHLTRMRLLMSTYSPAVSRSFNPKLYRYRYRYRYRYGCLGLKERDPSTELRTLLTCRYTPPIHLNADDWEHMVVRFLSLCCVDSYVLCVRACAYIYVCIYICTYQSLAFVDTHVSCIRVCIHTYIRIYIRHIHIRAYMHTYVCIDTYIHT
jgi:hypothetical protein